MSGRRLLGAAAAAALLCGLGLGCRRAPEPTPDLEITRYRYNLDEKADVVRVVGEIVNRGATRVPQVEVRATLISLQGTPRGDNSVTIAELAPGEARTFAVDVTSHGGVSQVELTWQLPPPK